MVGDAVNVPVGEAVCDGEGVKVGLGVTGVAVGLGVWGVKVKVALGVTGVKVKKVGEAVSVPVGPAVEVRLGVSVTMLVGEGSGVSLGGKGVTSTGVGVRVARLAHSLNCIVTIPIQ